jgi:hypothetical protein
MTNGDLWWLFVDHREECLQEFWEEVENRKADGILSKNSPFWSMGNVTRHFQTRGSDDDSNLIELTREEWEAHRRQKMFRVPSA